jgi:putative DNA-invertase from lambdoid prophage Rac
LDRGKNTARRALYPRFEARPTNAADAAHGHAQVRQKEEVDGHRRVKDVGSGATTRPKRESLIAAARRRETDLVLVWRLDRWGRSLVDLVSTLQELNALDVGFVSLSEALDLTTPSGRALAGMLAVFAEFERDILRDRLKAGIAQARSESKPHGRPETAANLVPETQRLRNQG